MQITTARPEDIDEVWAFIDTAFGFIPGHFRDRLTPQWVPECVDWDGVFIIRGPDGALDSLVRLWELSLVQNGREVVCGGIGSVSTGKHARGQGGMSALMEHAANESRRRGYAFNVLGGDRFRYATFGYESAGRTLNLSVGPRGLKRQGIQPIEPFDFDESLLARVEATRAQHPYHVRRRVCEIKHVYDSPERHVLAAGDNDTNFGFMTLEVGNLREWGGAIHTVLGLAAFAIGKEWAKTLNFALPYGTPVPEVLHHTMSNWSVTPAFRAVIYDLDKTLHAFDAEQYQEEFSKLNSRQQVWELWGKPDAPRNLWFSHLDLV